MLNGVFYSRITRLPPDCGIRAGRLSSSNFIRGIFLSKPSVISWHFSLKILFIRGIYLQKFGILVVLNLYAMETFPTPKVVVSRCLGFEACRYDGSVINDPFVPMLKPHVEFITPCPEKEIGLGVPRKPVRLVQQNEHKHLFQPATGSDVTDKMQEYIDQFLENLGEVDGFILRHRSPYCGLRNEKIY